MSCVICSEAIDTNNSDDYVKLTEKGCNGINKANRLRNLDVANIVWMPDSTHLVHKP